MSDWLVLKRKKREDFRKREDERRKGSLEQEDKKDEIFSLASSTKYDDAASKTIENISEKQETPPASTIRQNVRKSPVSLLKQKKTRTGVSTSIVMAASPVALPHSKWLESPTKRPRTDGPTSKWLASTDDRKLPPLNTSAAPKTAGRKQPLPQALPSNLKPSPARSSLLRSEPSPARKPRQLAFEDSPQDPPLKPAAVKVPTSTATTAYESSSDEEVDDLLAEFRARMQKNQPSESSCLDSIRDSGKKQPPTGSSFAKDDPSLEEVEETPKKEKRCKPSSKTSKRQAANDEENNDDNDNKTDDSSEVSDPGETLNPRRRPNKRLDKSLMADSSSEEEDEQDTRRARAKPRPKDDELVHNPITLMRRQQQQQVPIPKDEDMPTENGASLWSDSENEQQESEPDTKMKRGKKKKKEKKKKKKSTGNFREDASYSRMLDTSQEDAETRHLLRLDEDMLRQTLKPEFSEPRFGPFDLEPLVLKRKTSRGISIERQVPASINRYLLPYQREGVSFLFNALSARKGAILGDEMGLGKTVQILGLLCALFKKTGTGMDVVELNRRRELVREKIETFKEQQDEALMQGRVVSNTVPDFREDLRMPEWYPVLIIVPPSVLQNWRNEFATWTHFGVAAYAGNEREQALESIRTGSAEVLLTAKSLFMAKEGFRDLNKIKWKLVIVDEFHLFKNKDGYLSDHLRQLKSNHRCLVIGMTGTLMQNDHSELWNLVDLVETDYLGDYKDFKDQVSIPIKIARTKTAEVEAIEKSDRICRAFMSKMSSIYIERTKDDVLDGQMPTKNELVVICEPSALQKRIYAHILTLPDYEMLQKAHSPCDCSINANFFQNYQRLGSKAERLDYYRKHKDDVVKRSKCCYDIPFNPRKGEPGQLDIDPDAVIWRTMDNHDGAEGCSNCPWCCLFPALSKLYKLSSHVALLQADQALASSPEGSSDHTKFLKEKEFAKVAFSPDVIAQLPGGSIVRRDGIMDDHFNLSGKMKVLDNLLTRFSSECARVLLFSISTQTMDLIQNYLRSQGHSFLRMDGSTASSKRQEIADKFKNDPSIFVFLLSTKAMGLGLNLTEANKVIIFDVDWNPSWEAQAQDRAYRIGQKRDVQVFRLVARGTLEELKYLRQLYKVQLKKETLDNSAKSRAARMFRGVQGDKNRKGELFGTENLLKFKDGSFLDDIWKQTGNSPNRKSGDLDIHETLKLSSVLQGIGKEGCDELLDEEPGMGLLEQVAEQRAEAESGEDHMAWRNTHRNQDQDRSGNESLEEREISPIERGMEAQAYEQNDSIMAIEANAVNHEDLFREDRGRAAIQPGEDGFDEEMGGGSQNLVAIYERGVIVHEIPPVYEHSDSIMNIEANAVNHEDLFREDRGRAAIEPGEDGFDEEMGGGSQNLVAIYERGVTVHENPQDGSYSDAEIDLGEQSPARAPERLLPSFREGHQNVVPQVLPVVPRRLPRVPDRQRLESNNAVQPVLEEHSIVGDTIIRQPGLGFLPEDTTVNPQYRAESSKSTTTRDDAIDDSESVEKVDKKVAAAANTSNRGGSYNIQLVGMPSRHIEEKDANTTFSVADLALPSYSSRKKKKKKKRASK